MLSQGTRVDLVLLDYLMPGMNGDELAERLRRHYPDLPHILVSAVGQLPFSLLESTNARVQKGQDPEFLLQTIAAVLARPEKKKASEGTAVKRTVLCVEDEKAQLKMRKMLLESAGSTC
jgi:CheY-like chemotaxis protein